MNELPTPPSQAIQPTELTDAELDMVTGGMMKAQPVLESDPPPDTGDL